MSALGDEARVPSRFFHAIKALGEMPRVIITTSRRPSRRTRSLVKDLAAVIDGAVRFTRGHESLKSLAAMARTYGIKSVVIVGERKGNPGLLAAYSVGDRGLSPVATIRIVGVTLSRELRGRSKPRCRYVKRPSDPAALRVAEALSKAFLLDMYESPPGDYLEVRNEGVMVVVPRAADGGFGGPIIRVLAEVEPGGGSPGQAVH